MAVSFILSSATTLVAAAVTEGHEAANAVAEHGAEAAHETSGAFPPFDPTYFPSQLFWLAIIFSVLYIFLAKISLPRIATVIEERKDKIVDDLDTANELKRQADDAIKAYETALAEAKAKAGSIAADTRAKLDKELKALQADAEASIADKTADAEKRIASAKTAALTNVREIAAGVSAEIVKALLDETIDQSRTDAAVTAALDARS